MVAPEFPPVLEKAVKVQNAYFGQNVVIILASLTAAALVINLVLHIARYTRKLACLNDNSQRFFKITHPTLALFKRLLLYAPLLSRQHSKKMQVGRFEVGILPTRFQSLLLAGIVAMNVTFSVYGMEWNGTPPDNPMPQQTLLIHLRNRTGNLAVFNMIPLVLIAGRNNPLIGLLGIYFNNFNLLHRWFGRIVVYLAVVHSVTQVISMNIPAKGISTLLTAFGKALDEGFFLWGFIALVAMCGILITSLTVFRNAFYETFLHIHIVLVSFTLGGLWLHLASGSTQVLIQITISVWAIERLYRLISLCYRNLSVTRASTEATIETLPGDAVRVTLTLARPCTFKPGQYVFLIIPSIGLWTSHPFSVAWSESIAPPCPPYGSDPEKDLPLTPLERSESDILATPHTSFSLVIRRRAGFTNNLFQKTKSQNGRLASVKALVEGPYTSSPNSLTSYGTVMLIAGGVGITHAIPHVRALVAGYAAGTVAARNVLLVWIIQTADLLEWIRTWMTRILAMYQRRDVLRIQIFVTRPRSTKEIYSPSATVQMFSGKPNIDTLIEAECKRQIGAMGVSVCGPGGLSDEVREVVRRRQGEGNIDLIEEGFGW